MSTDAIALYIKQWLQQILQFAEQGGLVMWPLFACSLWMVWLLTQTIFADRYQQLPNSTLFKKLITDHPKYKWLGQRVFKLELRNCQQRQYANLQCVKMLATIAPLLGLLGTVNGMIDMFEVGASVGFHDQALISTGISKAMVTTQTGLIVGLSGALMGFVWQRKLNKADIELICSQSTGIKHVK
ncbi:MotA/TolQ/ExbB proton channel family protein [Shewanella intestini]|uniref:MotA/TolQ/ExbB proton channel family protein n=1 Tax=Shewanella intestini TaxID=2017544 RepID=A0ABS5HYN7_9GAMM|nr:MULTISPECIES: MotA/TolQ/ExbB proton channel family protein [Shewanella]MBR9726908.1 MotA/TolQ/ExbB proton channel family protein [Shewanella intestini]MRG34526.1 MotA/TolQ/ExbB proton channel family protein [Shewanella sp. XMDDZSB0408]